MKKKRPRKSPRKVRVMMSPESLAAYDALPKEQSKAIYELVQGLYPMGAEVWKRRPDGMNVVRFDCPIPDEKAGAYFWAVLEYRVDPLAGPWLSLTDLTQMEKHEYEIKYALLEAQPEIYENATVSIDDENSHPSPHDGS